jgi:AbiV family abortive infection protein
LEHGRWPSALALAILSIEESGKEPLIRHILTTPPGRLRAEAWQAFADHRAKNVMAAFGDFFKQGARTLDDFQALIRSDSPHARQIEELKQSATYVAATDGIWPEPTEVITEEVARRMVETAERRVALPEWSADHYRIWKKHVAPALGIGDEAARAAIVAAYAEMAELGLVSNDDAAGMAAFVTKKIDARAGN